ncbi:MAG: hypothetical protein UIC65_04675 [Alphaproteobacteria bacterium]|nr:hypothetical protein [Alphaproteobacteria bacterium]
MACVKNILVNDIKDLLGHKPSKEEFNSALDYLNKYLDATTLLIDVEVTLRDWRDDCCKQCESCGEYFLIEDLEERWIGNGWRYVCSVDCYTELKNDCE